MRIISGFLKGKKINFFKNQTTRPLKDSVKENIFNILKHSKLIKVEIENSNVLDLYSGIGSFGLECISRGAKKVIFVEKDPNVIKILRKKLIKLSIERKSIANNGMIQNFLTKDFGEKFNILFLDPPFIDKEFIKNLITIKNKKLMKKNHIIIIHREKKTQDDFNNTMKTISIKEYGRSKIIFGTLY